MTTIILPIDPKYFWATVTLPGFAPTGAVVYAALPRTPALNAPSRQQPARRSLAPSSPSGPHPAYAGGTDSTL
ncbi:MULTISPECIES: hypothetical protein [unclassified Phaeobacter]|uniref:hypothetical protein n=1 Tax=unclassified Phaeobacter TaxID=2621772 RepID=UPI003A8C320B